MLLVVVFGIGMLGFGCFMANRPLQYSKGIAQFSAKPWYQSFEITSRLIVGTMLLAFSEKTHYPNIVAFLGGALCFVGIFLILIGPVRHKRFALLTSRIGKNFRFLGLVAMLCGAGLVYVGAA